eukprot:TRINITY_DN5453_c0_g1_i1.p1 TRINITY_DN5453_c0_g1~~TRINITY_DN5453_c0_g1_i1.p1  ORF type:complete len:256 (-),score=81.82 TRINITY_DN5453_c0_g1_i1:146-913(-)
MEMVERQIPDVWNIFDISSGPIKDQEILSKWCDRSSVIDRPRTYDKLYYRLPWTYSGESHSTPSGGENDDLDKNPSSSSKKTSSTFSKKKKKELNYSRTVTERDVKQLERHLSMKKTIRKKIMRDLAQAFVPDPDELAKNNEIKMQDALRFEEVSPERSDKLLDLLRDSSDDSGVAHEEEDDDDTDSGSKSRRLKTSRERRAFESRHITTPEASIPDADYSSDDNLSTTGEVKKEEEKSSWWDMLMGRKKKKNKA